MENQHRQITGYRDLSQAEIDLMNRIKAHGQASAALLGEVYKHCSAQYHATDPAYKDPTSDAEEFAGTDCIDSPEQLEAKSAERSRLSDAEMFRWHAIAKTHLQEGLMALTRAVAQPSKALIHCHPHALPRAELADQAAQSAGSSGYANNLGALRSLGFIDYPAPGSVAARPELFLE